MKKWEKPTLIVLVRSEPQESIMTVCKTPPEIQGVGAGSAFNSVFLMMGWDAPPAARHRIADTK